MMSHTPSTSPSGSALGGLASLIGLALGLGVAWLALELILLALAEGVFDPIELVRRGAQLLPWQLALFAAIGVALAIPSRVLALGREGRMWWLLAGASVVFLGARVGEGLSRQHTLLMALLAVACIFILIGAMMTALWAIGRRLPQRVARGWPLATWSAWSLLFVLFLRRAGPALSNGKTGPWGWLEYLEPLDVGAALLLAGLVLACMSGLRGFAAGAAGAAVALLASNAMPIERVAERPDVIVVLIDTFRFDYLGANEGREDLTPELDAVARESIHFPRAFSPSNLTARAMPGVMTSMPAPVTGRRLPEGVESLAALLREAGYSTFGISTNPNVSFEFGYHQGFDRFIDPTGQYDFLIVNMLQILGTVLPGPAYNAGLITAGLYYRPFEEVRRRGLALLERSRGPAFLYLHTMDPHGPYLPPKSYLPREFEPSNFYPYFRFNTLSGRGVLNRPEFAARLRNLRQRYEGEVRYSDAEFGRLVRALQEAGRWDESILFVLSDHGEAFGEHDYAGHGGANLTQTLIRVPFFVKLPRSWGVASRVEQTPVSTFDLLPTALGLIGERAPASAFGRDLGPLLRGEAQLAPRVLVSHAKPHNVDHYSGIDWPWKLDVRAGGEEAARQLFHLERDPTESTDLSAEHPAVVERLAREVEAWRTLERERVIDSEDFGIGARLREQLRQLGYAD